MMSNTISNCSRSSNSFEAPQHVGGLGSGRFFLFCKNDDEGTLMLGMVINPEMPNGETAFATFENVGTDNDIPVFKADVLDTNKYQTSKTDWLVLPYRPTVKVEVEPSTLNCEEYFLVDAEKERNRIGRVAFAQSSHDQDDICFGVILNSLTSGANSDMVSVIETGISENEVRKKVIVPSYQFDEWHGVVDDERVFTVRSFGLLDDLEKKKKQ